MQMLHSKVSQLSRTATPPTTTTACPAAGQARETPCNARWRLSSRHPRSQGGGWGCPPDPVAKQKKKIKCFQRDKSLYLSFLSLFELWVDMWVQLATAEIAEQYQR